MTLDKVSLDANGRGANPEVIIMPKRSRKKRGLRNEREGGKDARGQKRPEEPRH